MSYRQLQQGSKLFSKETINQEHLGRDECAKLVPEKLN